MAISKSDARRLAMNATEIGAYILRGVLTIESDGIKVNGTNVSEWLAQHANSELMLIATPVGKGVIESDVKSCHTCGRDYKGDSCPYCAEARARLRG